MDSTGSGCGGELGMQTTGCGDDNETGNPYQERGNYGAYTFFLENLPRQAFH